MPFLAINMDGIMDWKEGGQITMSEVNACQVVGPLSIFQRIWGFLRGGMLRKSFKIMVPQAGL